MQATIYTIGHSTRPIDQFIKILHKFEIGLITDVRTIPRSRFNPQFNKDELKEALEKNDIGYIHLEKLGGLRHATKASVNTAWKNSSFRGFADYMQTDEFQTGLEQLLKFASGKRTALMCAEAVPWRCHRSLIADALLVRNFGVEDILNEKNSSPHKITPWATVDGVSILYPGPPA